MDVPLFRRACPNDGSSGDAMRPRLALRVTCNNLTWRRCLANRGRGTIPWSCRSFNAARVGRSRTQTDSSSLENSTAAGEVSSAKSFLRRYGRARDSGPAATTPDARRSYGDAGNGHLCEARFGSSDSRVNKTPRGPRGRGAGGSGTGTEGLGTTRTEGVHGFHGFPGEGCPLGWGGRGPGEPTPEGTSPSRP